MRAELAEIRGALDDLRAGFVKELQDLHEQSQALCSMYGTDAEIETTSEDWYRWLKETEKFCSPMETS